MPRILLSVAWLAVLGTAMFLALSPARTAQKPPADPLPSWNNGPVKDALLRFVRDVTEEGGQKYVPPAQRIATFDNDGTLWVEMPWYPEMLFSVDRVRALADSNPTWRGLQPFKAALENDRARLMKLTDKEYRDLTIATHTGMTDGDYQRLVPEWLAKNRHPRYQRPYPECVYQPQLELLAFLRANGFKTFIVTGGGIDFVRSFAEKSYGVPPEQVIGTTCGYEYQLRDGKPELYRLPQLPLVANYAGKPAGIGAHLGRRPILAFGNSDGDQQMLEYTDTGDGPRLLLLLHHDDAEREYAYDRQSLVGRLDRAWDEAKRRDWIVVSMKNDFQRLFPWDPEGK